jgi:hypothetical protein
MEAHLLRCAALVAALASMGASYRTNNFIVNAPTAEMAEQIGRAAEKYRHDLALDWLGKEMPNWRQPCPITCQVGDHLGAGGATSFVFEHGEVFGWRMTIQGSLVRILDSVLPHEVTHTVFATHFRRPLPRWADEGACTTVEHQSERAKQQTMLVDFLRNQRGIAFSQMFAMKEYPHDVMPLYSQGYSVARYLIAEGGKQKFLEFLADGMRDENWTRATQQHYGRPSLGVLQNEWLAWVRKGSPALAATDNATLVAVKASDAAQGRARPEANLTHRGRSGSSTPDSQASASDRADAASVYALAATSKNALTGTSTRQADEWHAPRSSDLPGPTEDEPTTETVGERDDNSQPAAQYQVTRPQPVQRARQVILEWSRPHQAAENATAGGTPGGYPAPSTN